MKDESFWEEVERARKMTPEQRFMSMLDMIDVVRELRIAGIKHDFPDAKDDEINTILRKRIETVEALDVVR